MKRVILFPFVVLLVLRALTWVAQIPWYEVSDVMLTVTVSAWVVYVICSPVERGRS